MGLSEEEELLPANPLLLSMMRKNMQSTHSSSDKDDDSKVAKSQDIGIDSLGQVFSNLQLK